MTKIYQLSAAGKGQLVRRAYFLLGGVLSVALGFSLWNLARQSPDLGLFTLVPVVVFVGIVVAILLNTTRQQRALLDSIRIVVGEDFIARHQANTKEVRLRRGEVTQLRETADGLCVLTADPRRTLLVPRQLSADDYQTVLSVLSTWAPYQPGAARASWLSAVIVLGSLAGFAILFLSPWLWLVIPVGLAMFSYYLYLAWMSHRSEGVDARTRRGLWLGPIFIAFITAMKVCVLTNAFVVIMEVLASAGR